MQADNFKQHNRIPSCFSDKVKTVAKIFVQELEKLEKNKILDVLIILHEAITKMQAPENMFWEEANILLNTSVIKSLPEGDARNLVHILSDLKESKQLEAFLKDSANSINLDILEKEVKCQKLRNKVLPNLKTLLAVCQELMIMLIFIKCLVIDDGRPIGVDQHG